MGRGSQGCSRFWIEKVVGGSRESGFGLEGVLVGDAQGSSGVDGKLGGFAAAYRESGVPSQVSSLLS